MYTKSALSKSPQLAAVTKTILFDGLVPRISHDASVSQPTEILELSYSMCIDLVNAYLFGQSCGSKFLTQGEEIKPFLEHYENRYCAESFWPQELPRLTASLAKMGLHLLPERASASKEWLESWMMTRCKAADAAMQKADPSTTENIADYPTVYAHLKGTRNRDANLNKFEIASELFDHMGKCLSPERCGGR